MVLLSYKNLVNPEKIGFSYNVFCDSLFFLGLYLITGGACISNLRFSPSGFLITNKGGVPFLYEYGVAIVLFALFIRFLAGIKKPNNIKTKIIAGISFFYIPIFVIFFIGSGDLSEFIGGGQLRLQLEVFLTGLAVILYPIEKYNINKIFIIIVLGALLNGFIVVFSFYGIVDPIYLRAWRSLGRIRYSGLFDMPASLGFLSSAAIAYVLWSEAKKALRIIVFSVCMISIVLADSRTAMVAVIVLITFKLLMYFRIFAPAYLFMLISFPIAFICSLPLFINILIRTDAVRLESFKSVFYLFKSFPFGIPWGTFDLYNPYPLAVSPHNWPAIGLLYGGVLSFLAVVIFHFYLFKTILNIKAIKKEAGPTALIIVFILLALTCSAWFEQALQTAFSSFTFIIMLAFLSHYNLIKKHSEMPKQSRLYMNI